MEQLAKYELWVICIKDGASQDVELHSTFETDCVLTAIQELMQRAREDLLDSYDCVRCEIKSDGRTVHQETVHPSGTVGFNNGQE